ncbi:MAG: RNA polymerase sigma-70 factor [Rhodothermales bacterium]
MPNLFDIDACTALFSQHYPDLVRYARSIAGDAGGAEDAVQDAFLRLWKRRETIDPERSVRSLLYRAVRNLVLNEARDAALHRDLLKDMQPNGHAPMPDAAAGAGLIGDRMRGWIGELPERRREAFELSRFYGLSYDEIAGIMGVSKKTVENHIRLALQHLRDRLHQFDPHLLRT